MTVFYSRNTGNWEDGANWSTVSHVGVAGSSPGAKGTDWPGSGDTAIISAGHIITITTNLSTEASPILLSCDNPGTNNGTLKFSPTANTGLKFTEGTINAASTLNIFAGERLAPIRRGNTCILTTGDTNFDFTTGTLNIQLWGQHREMGATDIYADILTANLSEGSLTASVSGSVSPIWSANDWVYLIEQESSASIQQKAELIQLDSYSVGTMTFKTKTKYAYTTGNCLLFKANKYFVNTILDADHTLGASTFIFEDDIWPSGVPGGSMLITNADDDGKANNENLTSSSYNSGTKTLTISGVSTKNHVKSSVALLRDHNITFSGGATRQLGGISSGTVTKWVFALSEINLWREFSRLHGLLCYQSNFIDVQEPTNGSLDGFGVYGYGLGMGFTPASASSVNPPFAPTDGSGSGYHFIRCRLTNNDDSISQSRFFDEPFGCYFEDCIIHSSGRAIMNNPTNCVFKNCGFGATLLNAEGVVFNPTNCIFDNVAIWKGSTIQGTMTLNNSSNLINHLIVGETLNGKSLPGSYGLEVGVGNSLSRINGIKFDPGFMSEVIFNSGVLNFDYLNTIRCSNNSFTENTFKNFTKGGYSQDDQVEFRSIAPSIKFQHSSNLHPIYHDIPVYVEAGLKSVNIYTKTSTASWDTPPQLLILNSEQFEVLFKRLEQTPYLHKVEQITLTPGSYQLLSTNFNFPTTGIYVIRLWSRNASGTVNWDDFVIA